MRSTRIAVITAALLVAMTVSAFAQGNPCNPSNPCAKKGIVFHVDDPAGRNSVTFKSQAPLEDIVGITNSIKGHIKFNPMKPDMGGMAQFEVDAGSFNTGIPLRDDHLRSADWLAAKKHSKIMLKINNVKNVRTVKSTAEAATFDVDVEGRLSMRGVEKTVRFPARMTYLKESEKTKAKMPGNLLAVRAEFEVALADFGIKGPKGAGLVGSKVGERILVEVSLMGSTAAAMAGNPCNPCGGNAAKNPCNPCGGKKAKNPCNPCGK